MRYSILILLLFSFSAFAQMQTLSRHDSAIVSKHQENYEQQLNLNNKKEASRFLNEMAFIYWNHNNTQQAIKYYEKSWDLNKDLSNENGMAMLNNNLGMLYADLREYEKSLAFFRKTLATRKSNNETTGVIQALINISVILNNLKRFDESAEGLTDALSLARKQNDVHEMRSVYSMLSETYEKKGDSEKSFYYFNLYRTFNDLIQREEFTQLQTTVDEEKLLRDVAEAKNKINEEEITQKKAELTKIENELDNFDSLNRSLFDNLNSRELQFELLKQKASLDSLGAQKEINANLATIERERGKTNMIIIIAVFLSAMLFFIIRSTLIARKKNKILTQQKVLIEGQNTQLGKLNEIINEQNERMKTELNVAKDIQMSMVPEAAPKFKNVSNVDLNGLLKPAREVGGDFYNYFFIDEKHLCFLVGDVSGKGVPAALLMAVTQALLKSEARNNVSTSEIVTHVNNEISKENSSYLFITLFVAILNTESGKYTYTNAGHNPTLIKKKNGVLEKLKDLHGPVVGAMEGVKYKESSGKVDIGDLILAYTDGVTEANNMECELYSDQRLEDLLSNNGFSTSKELTEVVISDVHKHENGAEQFDDITILSVCLS
jgi:serine phosphatase RsbU (regulator of sigma subunit)